MREAMRLPRVLAHEDADLGLGEVGPHDGGAEHGGVHPELAGLLLGQRTGAELRPVGGQRRAGVGAPQMVALATTAVVEDRLTAVLGADGPQPGGDLGDGGVPADLLVGAVGPAAQRAQHPLGAAVLVAVQPQRLLAGVALGARVPLVAPHLLQAAAVGATEADLEAAVALAQDAGGGRPGDRHAGDASCKTLLSARLPACAMPNCPSRTA